MQTALHLTTHVLPGNRIEITAPELKEGAAVEVFLVLPVMQSEKHPSALEVIEALKGHRLFQSAKEVDQYLKEERDSWDR